MAYSNVSDAESILSTYQASGWPPAEILARLDSDLRDAYWKAKDLSRVIALGKAGIDYAMQLADESKDRREQFLQSAKTMAYNVASFSWPGWDEPGIVITEDQLKYGFTCAKLNLQLAIELNRPAEKIADADWLIGAHRLAQSDWQAAHDAFLAAYSANPKPLMKGYILLARQAIGDPLVEKEWEALIETLDIKNEHQAFVRSQLLTASRVFLGQ